MNPASPPLQLWLVRHGETEWSRQLKHTGRSDIPLTAHGRAQALGLQPALAGLDFDRVLCSPLGRARETARLAGFDTANIEWDDELMEWDYGEFEGQTSAALRQRLGAFDIWRTPVTAGESLEAVAARAERVLQRLSASGGRCLLFSHGHLLRILTARWLGLAATCGRLFVLDAAAVCILGQEHEQRAILSWNVRCPLGQRD